MFLGINVNAKEYGLYELIPISDKATVETEHFLYRDFYYNYNEMQANSLKSIHVIFSGIKNITNEKEAISISIALFDSDKKNIGVVNYCSTNEKYTLLQTELEPNEEISYSIGILQKHLIDGKNINDVKYFAVIGDNNSCSMAGVSDYAGKTIEEMKDSKGEITINNNTKYFIYIVAGAIGLLVVGFIIKFILTGGKSREDMIRAQYRVNTNINNNPNPSNDNNVISSVNQNPSPSITPPVPEEPKKVVDTSHDDHGSNLFDMYK